MDNIPNFIGVGCMKSGTTTLMHHLSNHSKIHIPTEEIHFFNNNSNYKKGMEWYRSKLLENAPEREVLVGEKTPTYSYQENVAERIYEHCPSAKLIWIFRNPVDRTYSNYLHAYKKGGDLLSFEKAITKEDQRVKKDVFKGYKQRSIFHLQVERFLEYFPQERMYFMLFEDLIKPYSPNHVLNDLFLFLGVSEHGFKFEEQNRNKTVLPRFPTSLYLQKKLGLTNNSFIHRLSKVINFYNKNPGYDKMKLKTREELLNYFKPYNRKLSKLIGKDLSAWEE